MYFVIQIFLRDEAFYGSKEAELLTTIQTKYGRDT